MAGFHPVWNEEFTFSIAVPELCVIRFRVIDHESRGRDELVAQYCVPFKCLQQGTIQPHSKIADSMNFYIRTGCLPKYARLPAQSRPLLY